MFTPEEQAQIDVLLAEATQVSKQGSFVEEGYVFNRRLSDDATRLFERYMAEKHGIFLLSTRYEFKPDADYQLPRMFGKDG